MLRTLLSGLPVIQVAVVVRDLEACIERQNASLGNGLGDDVVDRVDHHSDVVQALTALVQPLLGMIVEVIEPPTSLGEPTRRL